MANDLMLREVHKTLNNLLISKTEALPKDINKTRFLQNCMTVPSRYKRDRKMQSNFSCKNNVKRRSVGLDFMNKECYAIPYGNGLQFPNRLQGRSKACQKIFNKFNKRYLLKTC